MHEILLRIFDDGDVFEIAEQRSPSMITAFARVDGHPVGVIANQPMHMSGAVGNEASDKAAGFIRFCDSFNLPLVFVVDTPGAMPGVEEEKGGIIKRGGRFFNAIVEADVPKVTIIDAQGLRRWVRGDGFQAAVGRPELRLADRAHRGDRCRGCGPAAGEALPRSDRPRGAEDPRDFIEGYNLNLATPWIAAERGYIDGVIEPHETRLLLRKSLQLLRDKQILAQVQRKHGLTPL